MAIALEFNDFVVPISVINEKYPGGWKKCLADNYEFVGETVWYDDYLFRTGAMDWQIIKARVERWRDMGFQVTDQVDGRLVWKDVCVIESMMYGPTLPCHWLSYDPIERSACLKGYPRGKLIHRGNVCSDDSA